MSGLAGKVATHLPFEKIGGRRRYPYLLSELRQVREIIEIDAEARSNCACEQVLKGETRRELHVRVVGNEIRIQDAVACRGQDADRPRIPVDGRVIVLVLETARLVHQSILRQIAEGRLQGDWVDV